MMRKRMRKYLLIVLALIITGCTAQKEKSYTQISMDEAVKMMETNDDYIIVDVRTPEEYAGGHIPKAINIPNETIGDNEPAALADKKQIIMIYCRSGNRSKQVAKKLFNMGYENIYEFGGINDWKGEIVVENQQRSIDADLAFQNNNGQINGYTFDIDTLIDLADKLTGRTVKVSMEDDGNGLYFCSLPWELESSENDTEAKLGDIIVYEGNKLAICYRDITGEFIRIGHINAQTEGELKTFFNEGSGETELLMDWYDY